MYFSFQPEDRDKLKTAVDEWIDNSTSANSTYGNTWDTSLITECLDYFLILIVSMEIFQTGMIQT